MQKRLSRSLFSGLAAVAALLALALPARAVKTPAKLDGSQFNLVGSSSPNPDRVFDNDPSSGIPAVTGQDVVADFSPLLGTEEEMYVSRIDVTHKGDSKYSLYTSIDGTEWDPVADAQEVHASGTASYFVSSVANFVKCSFDSSAGNGESLYEIEVWGYAKQKSHVVSKWSQVSMVNILWGANTFGGGTGAPDRVFNGTFGDYQMLPRTASWLGSYFLIDFTADSSEGYYVDNIIVDSTGTKKFSLEYSSDGNTWKNVEGATSVAMPGKVSFPLGALAKKVKYVFVGGGDGSFSEEFLAEIQVWGVNPDDVPCMHPSFTEWVENIPATCVERARQSRTCTACGERFTKISDSLPLGHDYVSTLSRPGRWTPKKDMATNRKFGEGVITCSRCDFRLEFPTEIDLVTSRVDNVAISGVKTEGAVRFTDLSVSSTDHPEWGPADFRIIDNVWKLDGWSYWVSAKKDNQYIDFDFGTTIDLTGIDLSVKNHGYLLEFFSRDESSGEERAIGSQSIRHDDTVVGTTTETTTVTDPETGEEHEVEVEKEVYATWQRIKIPFYETPVKNLRIRITDEEPTNLDWGNTGVCIIECHPWGTVVGASDYEADKTTFVIFK